METKASNIKINKYAPDQAPINPTQPSPNDPNNPTMQVINTQNANPAYNLPPIQYNPNFQPNQAPINPTQPSPNDPNNPMMQVINTQNANPAYNLPPIQYNPNFQPNYMNPYLPPPPVQYYNVNMNSPPRQQNVGEQESQKDVVTLGRLFKYSFAIFLFSLASLITNAINKVRSNEIEMGYLYVPKLTDAIIALDALLITYFIAFNLIACIAEISKLMLKIITGLFFFLFIIRFGLSIGYLIQCIDLFRNWLYSFALLVNGAVFRSFIAAFLFEIQIIFQSIIFLILTFMHLIRVISH